MNNDLTVRKATDEDIPELHALLQNAKAEKLSIQERAKLGFIQGNFDSQILTSFVQGLGIYTIKNNNEIVATAFTAQIGTVNEGPIVKAVDTVFKLFDDLLPQDVFLYGPVVIKAGFKGKGLLTLLLLSICSDMSIKFKKGLAFVDADNEVSIAIHLHYFKEVTSTFLFNEHKYYAFLFDPKYLLQKYNKI